MATPAMDPNKTPLALNPSGALPNFIDPPTLAPTTLATGIVFIILSTVCVVVRVYTNLKHMRKLGIDDYCVILGQLSAIAFFGVIYSLAIDGAARHSWDVPISFLNSSFTSRQFTSQILGSVVRFSVTAAIIILYMRLFSVLKWIPIVSYCLYVFLFLIQVENIGVALYWYIPRSSDVDNVQGALARITKTASSAIANAACTTVLDIILFIIPFMILPTLKLSTERRRACYLAFFIGILVIVADCVGVAYKTYGVVKEIGDPFWIGQILIIILNVEFFTLIIIACGPAISTFYVGTFMKSPFYSSLQYSMQRLKGTERSGTASHAPSADNSNKYKTNTYAATGNYQEISVHSTKSLVSNNQNNVELEPQKPSQVYPYSTLGEQELGNIRPRP